MDDTPWIEPSLGSTVAFVGVLVFVVVCFVAAAAWSSEGRARGAVFAVLGASVWVAVTGAYVHLGGTRAGAPGLMGFFLTGNLGAIALAFSPLGTRMVERLPLVALVAFQAFRLPLELVLHGWGERGTMPVQMTFAGHNFDILTGVVALTVGAYALITRRDVPRAMALAFNALGSALLLVVVAIVLLSSPIPIKAYDGPPILVALHLPYAWIVPVCVAGALFAHVLLWRALFGRSSSRM